MPSIRISASRRGGTCGIEYAHDIRIQPGHRTIVTTYYPGDEQVRDFGVAPFSRHRACLTCTASKLSELNHIGALHTVRGLTVDDLIAAGVLTQQDADDVGEDLRAVVADWAAVAEDMRVVLSDIR